MITEQLYRIYRDSKGISTDSRTVRKGQIFFALWGDNYNGNKFAAEAIQRGAYWAVIDDPAFETEKTILVDDCLLELQMLATHYRKELKAKVLAITGTNGKTTTKELLASILSSKYKVHATKGNLNNQIGVPLTILSAPPDTEVLIIEMGASHIGEIHSLCLIARPDYGIITNIGTAHIEGFGTYEGVIKAKTELYEYLRKVNGIALYNDKDQLLSEKIYKLINRAVPFSDPTGVDLVLDICGSGLQLELKANYMHKDYTIKTNLFGSYNYENVKAAVATGLFLEVEMDQIVKKIKNYTPDNNRSQLSVTDKNTIIRDAYNANPSSMKLAIESFSAIEAPAKLCILGDMLELAEKSRDEHNRIIELLKEKNLKEVLLLGQHFSEVSRGSSFKSFQDIKKLKEYLKAGSYKGYHILVKGSRGMEMEKVYEDL